MKENHKPHHTIDILFILTLFCVFTCCAVGVVYIGSRIYSSSADSLSINFNNHNAIDYISQKIHQSNTGRNIELVELDATQIVAIHETYQEQPYTTYIYFDDKQLKEAFISDATPFDKGMGKKIMDVDELTFTIEENILHTYVSIDEKSHHNYLSLGSGGGAS